MDHLKRRGEFEFIRAFTRELPQGGAVLGTGDDCAVLPSDGALWLASCDASVEGVHFRLDWCSPRDAGWKAAAGAISDIAAMGGTPRFMLAAAAAPPQRLETDLAELCAGVAAAAESYGTALVGGDMTRSPGLLFVDIAVLGIAAGGRYLTRSGAVPGDALAVTGWPGRAAAGLEALERGIAAPELIYHQVHPEPRIAHGRWLAGLDGVHAAIDVSDGLAQDAGHIAEASGVTLALRGAALPRDGMLEQYAKQLTKPCAEYILRGGESYELAVALDPAQAQAICDAFTREFDLPLTVAGEFTGGESCVLLDGQRLEKSGFDHFSSSEKVV